MHISQSQSIGHTVPKRHRHRQLPRSLDKSEVPYKARLTPDPMSRCFTMPASDDCTSYPELLSVFNQCSPRVYLCVVLCFPYDDRRREETVQHLRQSLKRLANERPIFAGRLHAIGDGKVLLRRSRSYDIPFEVVGNEDGEQIDYKQLRNEEFPPETFVHSRFGVPGLVDSNHSSLPVSKVQATFARGGLLLSIFLHHALTDGGSLKVFLEAFGSQTRNIPTHLPSEQKLRIPGLKLPNTQSHKYSDIGAFKRLVTCCPEYTILPDLSGPTQPRLHKTGLPIPNIERIGKIFVFTTDRLQQLRELVRLMNGSSDPPTAYMSLAALAFAHITKARIKTEKFLAGIEPGQTGMLWNSVNWRSRAFPGATDNYFGNAALPAVTRIAREQLNAACYDDHALARLVPLVKESIDVVDEEYVSRRMAMMYQAPDPRMVGVNYDPRTPESLAFNTWRHFGADVEWEIPGVPVTKPDSIRRASGGWTLGTALILPAKAEATKQELFVSLSVDAMEALCQDDRWMRWVDRIIS
ncbi:hypothetical protein F5Y19DRAFT_228861 [Xylariaceae sp. FL1651]|nr:hypothetical protein F5Y19DRAFT_228861 [Xylariaceae sp. FL1651]